MNSNALVLYGNPTPSDLLFLESSSFPSHSPFFKKEAPLPKLRRGPSLIRKETKESAFYDKSGPMAVLH